MKKMLNHCHRNQCRYSGKRKSAKGHTNQIRSKQLRYTVWTANDFDLPIRYTNQ